MTELKSEYCCDIMNYYVITPKEQHELIRYHPETRDYNLLLHGYDLGFERPMYYCPWCGAKLPKELNEEWSKAIEKLGFNDMCIEELEKLPEEFKTDKWWKKRGL